MTDEPLDRAVRWYRDDKRSVPEIAAKLGWPVSRTRSALIAVGVQMRTRVEGSRIAKAAGRGISPQQGKYRRTPVTLAKLSWSRAAIERRRREQAANE